MEGLEKVCGVKRFLLLPKTLNWGTAMATATATVRMRRDLIILVLLARLLRTE